MLRYSGEDADVGLDVIDGDGRGRVERGDGVGELGGEAGVDADDGGIERAADAGGQDGHVVGGLCRS
jgi:hypothetical protein